MKFQREIMDQQESGTNIGDLVSHASLLGGWHCALFLSVFLRPFLYVDDQNVSSLPK
jgi:hypothetical protein